VPHPESSHGSASWKSRIFQFGKGSQIFYRKSDFSMSAITVREKKSIIHLRSTSKFCSQRWFKIRRGLVLVDEGRSQHLGRAKRMVHIDS
jgi:hypothetical protein